MGVVLAHALRGGTGTAPLTPPPGRVPVQPIWQGPGQPMPLQPVPAGTTSPTQPPVTTRSLIGASPYTRSLQSAATPTTRDSLLAPISGPAKIMQQDQGQDYAGQAGEHVLALGDAHIDAIKPNPGGFGTAIYYTVTSGPQKGQQFYVGHASPVVQVGQTVKRGDPVAQLVSPSLGGASTPYWTEVGFAKGGVPEYTYGPGGAKFDSYLRGLQGVQPTATTSTSVDLSGMNDVPKPLQSAIVAAAAKYGVPPQALAGIWREESGRTFPNPAVNSSGYGGLFGTTNGKAPTQAQADMAASVLADGLQKSGGNMAEALSYYNSGKLTGGYTSVPGYNAATYQAPTSTTNAGTDAGSTYTNQVNNANNVYTPADTSTSAWNLNTNFNTNFGTPQAQGWWNPGTTVPPGLQYIDPSVSQDVLNALNYNDPNLPKAQSALIQAINALRNPSAGLLASGQAASAMLAPSVRQALAAGQLQANTLTQFSRGQQALLGQIPAQVGSIYNQGVNTEAQLAAGTQAALQGANPTAAEAASLQRIGAPAAQIAQLQAQNQAAYQGGGAVLRGLGNLGAMTLNQQGTAAKAYAAQIPALANIQATQQLASLQSATSASIGKILAGQPGLAAKLFSTLTSGQNSRVKALQSYISNSQSQTEKGKTLALDYWKEGHTVAYHNGQLFINGERVDVSKFNAQTNAGKAANQAVKDTNDAIVKAEQLAQGADKISLMQNRDSAAVTYNADRLTQAQQKMQGFSLIPDPNNKGSYIVQPNAGYGAIVNPDGSVVTWKLATGGPAGPGTGKKTGSTKVTLPGYPGQTANEVGSMKKGWRTTIASLTPTVANPTYSQGQWHYPSGYSQGDLIDPKQNPNVQVTDPNTGQKVFNTLRPHVPAYNTIINTLLSQLPVQTAIARRDVINAVQSNPNYNQPGDNGRPYVSYTDYLGFAKHVLSDNPNSTAAQLHSALDATGLVPNQKLLARAVAQVFRQQPSAPAPAPTKKGTSFGHKVGTAIKSVENVGTDIEHGISQIGNLFGG